MASVRIVLPVDRPAAAVWSAVADAGAVHERLARGFVVDTQLRDHERVVTFVNGLVAKELLVHVDEEARRIAYAVVESRSACATTTPRWKWSPTAMAAAGSSGWPISCPTRWSPPSARLWTRVPRACGGRSDARAAEEGARMEIEVAMADHLLSTTRSVRRRLD